MQLPSLTDLLKSGAHFGHRASRWHPKMEPSIFGVRNDVHIINLEKTFESLQKASDFVTNMVASGGNIVFVGTKVQAKDIVKAAAEDCGMPYVINRWLGGTLTNFSQLRNRTKHFLDLKKKKESGELAKYTKKEQLMFSREIEDLRANFEGVSFLERLPNALFVVDIKHEKTAVAEAKQTGVNIVAVCDTNVNPTDIQYCIPGNDDALKSIELFVKVIAEAVKEGKKLAESRIKEAQARAVEQTMNAK